MPHMGYRGLKHINRLNWSFYFYTV